MSGETHRVRENTGNPAHFSIEVIVDIASTRAADPRPPDHPDSHFDRYVHDAVYYQAVESTAPNQLEQFIGTATTQFPALRNARRD